jgi:predicted peptidase
VTGHSMGGRGALYAASKMPDRFAAVVSLSPVGSITAWAEKLAPVPLWLFHGRNDQLTLLKEIEELVHAVEAAGGHPQLTVLPGRDHYILDVYDRPDIYKWLCSKRGNILLRCTDFLPCRSLKSSRGGNLAQGHKGRQGRKFQNNFGEPW